MATVAPSDVCGWFAASLMLLTFLFRDPRYLRTVAVLANLAFIRYGVVSGLMPVLVLHAILLPVNLFRLVEEVQRLQSP